MESFFEAIKSLGGLPMGSAQFSNLYGAAVRILLPVLAALLLLRCAKSLLTFRKEPEIWAWLCLPDGNQLPITHWENVIGRNKRSDIVIDSVQFVNRDPHGAKVMMQLPLAKDENEK